MRQAAGHTSPVLTIGDLVIDTARMTAMVDGQQAQLSQLEFRLLNYLGHQRLPGDQPQRSPYRPPA